MRLGINVLRDDIRKRFELNVREIEVTGQRIIEYLDEVISSCHLCLFVFGPKDKPTEIMEREFGVAVKLGVRIIPCVYHELKIEDLEKILPAITAFKPVYFDNIEDIENSLEKILFEVVSSPPIESKAAESPTPPYQQGETTVPPKPEEPKPTMPKEEPTLPKKEPKKKKEDSWLEKKAATKKSGTKKTEKPKPPPKPKPPKDYKYKEDESSPFVASDSPTFDDELGYDIYAHAIYKFLTSEFTNPPLTISIQAPWGGGKSSLMRMVQYKMDPKAAKQEFEAAITDSQSITVKQVLDKIKNGHEEPFEFHLQPSENKQCLTVWFNAWKYEDTEQVWAGLADAIIRQITNRLSLEDRIDFWIEFNRDRLESLELEKSLEGKIRKTWVGSIRRWVWTYASGFGAAGLTTFLESVSNEVTAGIGIVSSLVAVGQTTWQKVSANASVNDQLAEENDLIQDFLHIPDYTSKLGFAHSVEDDLRRVLKVISDNQDLVARKKSKGQTPQSQDDKIQVVVFIDDLDRCKPDKVAQVVGAVNRFISSDLLKCYFILGMDTEIVAAALEASHKDVIENLPKYSTRRNVGWKFMDKFVQLPVVLPPPESGNVKTFVETFAQKELEKQAGQTIERAEYKPPTTTTSKTSEETAQKPKATKPVQKKPNPRKIHSVKINKRIDAAIKADKDREKIADIIKNSYAEFSTNPRDIKRFVNMLNFYYFMCLARQNDEPPLPTPNLPELGRWLVLALKWPDVARWVLRGTAGETIVSKSDKNKEVGTKIRLGILEEHGKQADLNQWSEGIAEDLNLKASDIEWVKDDRLFDYFQKEHYDFTEEKRMSNGAGKGIY